ncbi:MAG: TlpA family protein disulfide reductase [Gammaproteobacteria bacterium]|nr:TlpA family protein disulfide reductase [Gammaproteobacteria bacterium]MDH5728361.1 TlpA family protein disulfide reductase [Gammaproteobacteria bacterium]
MPKPIYFGIIIGAVVLSFFAGDAAMRWFKSNPEAEAAAQAMKKIYRPSFQLKDVDGRLRNVDEWNGKVLVINFWATWCPPCRREMPSFIRLQEKYAAQGLQFVGIALDEPLKVQDFLTEMEVEYPNLIGGEAGIKLSSDYGNRMGALPYTVIIDRRGYIQFTQRGELKEAVAEKVIKELL